MFRNLTWKTGIINAEKSITNILKDVFCPYKIRKKFHGYGRKSKIFDEILKLISFSHKNQERLANLQARQGDLRRDAGVIMGRILSIRLTFPRAKSIETSQKSQGGGPAKAHQVQPTRLGQHQKGVQTRRN